MAVLETPTETFALPLVDLNRDRREERRQVHRRSRRHGTAILAITLVGVGVLAPLTRQAVLLRGELQKTERQAREAKSRLTSLTAASAGLDGRIGLWERLVQTQQSRRAWADTFPALAACLPPDVVLEQVQASRKDGDVALHLQGSARTMAGLRAFTTALAASPAFARLHLDEATADRAAGRQGLTFRLTGPMTTGASVSP